MKTILPSNSTDFERAADLAAARRLEGIPVARLATLFNPATCPLSVIEWIAWSFGVETWKNGMTEQEKRAAVSAAIEIASHRGTIGAVRNALAAFEYGSNIIEHEGTFIFDVEVDAGPKAFMTADYETALRAVKSAKNVRSHLGKFSFSTSRESRLALRAVCHDAEIVCLSTPPEDAEEAEALP